MTVKRFSSDTECHLPIMEQTSSTENKTIERLSRILINKTLLTLVLGGVVFATSMLSDRYHAYSATNAQQPDTEIRLAYIETKQGNNTVTEDYFPDPPQLRAAAEAEIPVPTIEKIDQLENGSKLYHLITDRVPGQEGEVVRYTAELRTYAITSSDFAQNLINNDPATTDGTINSILFNNTPELFNADNQQHYRLGVYFDPKDLPEGVSIEEYVLQVSSLFDPQRVQHMLSCVQYPKYHQIFYNGVQNEAMRTLTVAVSNPPNRGTAYQPRFNNEDPYNDSISGPGAKVPRNSFFNNLRYTYSLITHELIHSVGSIIGGRWYMGAVLTTEESVAELGTQCANIAWNDSETRSRYNWEFTSRYLLAPPYATSEGEINFGKMNYNEAFAFYVLLQHADTLGVIVGDRFDEQGIPDPDLFTQLWQSFLDGFYYFHEIMTKEEALAFWSATIDAPTGSQSSIRSNDAASDKKLLTYIEFARLKHENSTDYESIKNKLAALSNHPLDSLQKQLLWGAFTDSTAPIEKLFAKRMPSEIEDYFNMYISGGSSALKEVNSVLDQVSFTIGNFTVNADYTYPAPGYSVHKLFSLEPAIQALKESGTTKLTLSLGPENDIVRVAIRSASGSIMGVIEPDKPFSMIIDANSDPQLVVLVLDNSGEEVAREVVPFIMHTEVIPPTPTPTITPTPSQTPTFVPTAPTDGTPTSTPDAVPITVTPSPIPSITPSSTPTVENEGTPVTPTPEPDSEDNLGYKIYLPSVKK